MFTSSDKFMILLMNTIQDTWNGSSIITGYTEIIVATLADRLDI